ncbi:hypothetical protein [Actinomadura napierensis]|uniref:Uncharacterized protein n=1 Tax=Actinomadura napierensis TaxID=267854 RepID=A0ABN3AGE0_9ACTN
MFRFANRPGDGGLIRDTEGHGLMLRDVTPDAGLDTSDWVIGYWPDDY